MVGNYEIAGIACLLLIAGPTLATLIRCLVEELDKE